MKKGSEASIQQVPTCKPYVLAILEADSSTLIFQMTTTYCIPG